MNRSLHLTALAYLSQFRASGGHILTCEILSLLTALLNFARVKSHSEGVSPTGRKPVADALPLHKHLFKF
jgi:hypothetical protein